MENKLLKLIYLIVHILVEWIEAIFYFGLEFRDNFSNFINNAVRVRRLSSSSYEKVHIEQRLHELKKIPKHLAVILNLIRETDVDLSRLADLVAWSLSSGVNFISFYDFKGTTLFKTISASNDLHDPNNFFNPHPVT